MFADKFYNCSFPPLPPPATDPIAPVLPKVRDSATDDELILSPSEGDCCIPFLNVIANPAKIYYLSLAKVVEVVLNGASLSSVQTLRTLLNSMSPRVSFKAKLPYALLRRAYCGFFDNTMDIESCQADKCLSEMDSEFLKMAEAEQQAHAPLLAAFPGAAPTSAATATYSAATAAILASGSSGALLPGEPQDTAASGAPGYARIAAQLSEAFALYTGHAAETVDAPAPDVVQPPEPAADTAIASPPPETFSLTISRAEEAPETTVATTAVTADTETITAATADIDLASIPLPADPPPDSADTSTSAATVSDYSKVLRRQLPAGMRVRSVADNAKNYPELRLALVERFNQNGMDGVAQFLHDTGLFYNQSNPTPEYMEIAYLVDCSLRIRRVCGLEALHAFLCFYGLLDPFPEFPNTDVLLRNDIPINLHSFDIGALLARTLVCYHRTGFETVWTRITKEGADVDAMIRRYEMKQQERIHRLAAVHAFDPRETPFLSRLGPPAASSGKSPQLPPLTLAPSRLNFVTGRVAATPMAGFDPMRILSPADQIYLRALEADAPPLAGCTTPFMSTRELMHMMVYADESRAALAQGQPLPPVADPKLAAMFATRPAAPRPPQQPMAPFLPPLLGVVASTTATTASTGAGTTAATSSSASAAAEAEQSRDSIAAVESQDSAGAPAPAAEARAA